jgi:hypothetical protein
MITSEPGAPLLGPVAEATLAGQTAAGIGLRQLTPGALDFGFSSFFQRFVFSASSRQGIAGRGQTRPVSN